MNYLHDLYDDDIAYRESVLFIRDERGMAHAKLLHEAFEIIKAENVSGKRVWEEGRDFIVEGDTVALTKDTTIPSFEYGFPRSEKPTSESNFKHINGGWFCHYPEGELQETQVFITYKIKKRSKIYCPERSSRLQNVSRLMKSGSPIKLVVYGDSISAGRNADPKSGVDEYFPMWSEQLKELIEMRCVSNITLINTAVGGTKSEWGLANFEEYVLKYEPDLLILGFGMNDGTARVAPERYYNNIKTMVEATSNNTDVVLISTILPSPKAATEEGISFLGYQRQYGDYLKKLVGNRVDVFDMMEIHKDLLKHKKPEDLLENNINHPNDYLVRWYAQGLFRLIFD